MPSLRVALGTGAGSPALMALIFNSERPGLERETGHVLRVPGDGAGGWGRTPTDIVGTHGKEPRFFSNPLSKPDKHWELREG